MKKLIIYFLLLLALPTSLLAQPTATVGSTGADFATLGEAFDFFNNSGSDWGDVTLAIIDNTTETGAVLYESGHDGLSYYTSMTIYPTVDGKSISGSVAGPLIDLNGATNVTIDGRVDQAYDANLIITNTNTGASASTIEFINSAQTNTVQYCIIEGAETGSSSGVIFFSTASAGYGNDGNIIDYNSITCDAAGRPVNTIYSSGTSGRENSENIISNNNIYNFLNPGTASNGINLGAFTTSWTISGNSFYETASFVPTEIVAYNAIKIDNTSGVNFSVSDNFIGGSSASCDGSAWTKTIAKNNAFYAIYLNVGTGTVSNIQNNTIKNFAWSNSGAAAWTGIQIGAGDVNVGTSTGNTIGATTGTGSITVTGGATGTNVYGINITSGGTIDCQNNNIASITAANAAANATNFYGINKTATAGTTTISSNNIGSATTNSINASSTSTGSNQFVYGINNAGTGTITISSNTITNLNNATSRTSSFGTGRIDGIASSDGTNTITDNIIHDLKIANYNNASANNASVCGISLSNSFLRTVIGNTIYNLSNTYISFTGSVIGLLFSGNTGANIVSENFIHSLSVHASSNGANIYGIRIASGATTYSNNIISLGGSTATTIYGINEGGVAGNNNNLYFNTVYIEGSGTSYNSYALNSAGTENTRNFRNNIFVNTRSGGSDLHYAAYIAVPSTGGITCDYNDYYVYGTGTILGYYGVNKTGKPVVTGQDANSIVNNPLFTNAGGTTASNYQIGVDLIAVTGTGISTDYAMATRATVTNMGAWNRDMNRWEGATSTDWATSGNWTGGTIPVADSSIIFDDNPTTYCQLDGNRSVKHIFNSQSTDRLVTGGYKLTVKGNLNFSNGAQIDASAASSTVEFAGTAAQSIPSGAFYNNQVYNLTVNNSINVTFNGTLNLLNTLTTTSGLLNASTNNPTMMFGGASAQTIDASQFVSGKAYNLTIDNAAGATLSTDFTVDNSLTINSGKLLTVSAPKLLTVSGTLTNNGGTAGLVIKSDANGNDGKLINNTASVPGTVELYLSGGTSGSGARFHYFVPPVQSMSIGTTIAEAKTNLGLTYFNGDLVNYSESDAGSDKDAGWNYFDGYGGTTSFSTLTFAEGYNIYLNNSANDKITFKGSLNATDHSFSVSKSSGGLGWNLAGNPYPCNYNLESVTELTNSDEIDNTVYFNRDGGYGYWILSSNTSVPEDIYSDILPPMQGFFVHITTANSTFSGTLHIPASYKTASTAVPLRSKGAEGADIIKKVRLVLNNGAVPDETVVCLIDKATTGFDGDYDAYKLFGGGATTPFIYTELNAVKYAVNSVKGSESAPIIIPVTVVLKAQGTYKIDITEFENFEGINVVLKHGSIETNLSKNATYSFTSAAGTFTDFQLIIGNTATGVENLTKEKLKTWYSNNYLYINCPDEISSDRGSLIIYDIQGKMVYNYNQLYLSPGQTIQVPINLPKGLYVTHVIVNNKPFVSKIVVF